MAFSLADIRFPQRGATNHMPFVAGLELSMAAHYCQVYSE